MKRYNKISTIGIIVLFLVSFIGVEFNKHYCGCSDNVDISIYFEDAYCDGDGQRNNDACCSEITDPKESDEAECCEAAHESLCETATSKCETKKELYSIADDFLKAEVNISLLDDSPFDLFTRVEYETDLKLFSSSESSNYDIDIGVVTYYIIQYQNRCSNKSDSDSNIS